MSSTYGEELEKKNFLPFSIRHLTPQMVEVAKAELNENEKTRSSSIAQLRELIINEKNLKCRTDDEFLLQFLRARKFNVKNAFERLQTFYKVISKSFSDVLAEADIDKTEKALKSGITSLLPYRDKDGATVVFCKISNWNAEEFDASCFVHCCWAVALSAEDFPSSQVCGIRFLADARDISLQHMRRLSPRFLYLISKGFRDILPMRVKGIHILNASSIFRYLWSVVNIFLSEKIRKRVHFHDDNVENLHKYIPKEILPVEYGGDYPDFDPVESGSAEMIEFLPKYLQILSEGYRKE